VLASLEEAKAKGIKVHFRMKLTDSRWDDTGVKFTFANGETTEADFIVGADSVLFESPPMYCEKRTRQRVHGHHRREYRQAHAPGVRSGNPLP
jgi:hypothetical protein